jgi:tRNA 5-methylaminomethyl-2-thiouridine biosynthesis bifunctional protein
MALAMSDLSPYQLEYAQLKWQAGDTPEAKQFGDIYFSKQQGLEETEYVFLQHNNLQQRWRALDKHSYSHFSIAETGFGTGLNFLAAWRLWQKTAPPNARLHFISVEKHPLKQEDLRRALSAWPSLTNEAEQLLAQYPVLIPGHHCLQFGNVSLQLLLGDAVDGFKQCLDSDHPRFAAHTGPKVDAWFLDGFAPAKNPDMWREELFSLIGQLSKPGTSFATFTAAGLVRRGLQAVGFQVEKVPGYGSKREMAVGTFQGPTESAEPIKKGSNTCWAIPPQPPASKQVAVIGGGLAGTTIAYSLAKRGYQVRLFERHPELAEEASGNPQGILYTKLSHQHGLLNQFTLHSYLFASRFYQQLAKDGVLSPDTHDFCGMLQLACKDKEKAQWQKLQQSFADHQQLAQFVSAELASEMAGIVIEHPCIHFPKGGWIKPRSLCRQLVKHPNIEVQLQQGVLSLNRLGDHWQLQNQQGKMLVESEIVVIANSNDARLFEQTAELPLKAIRGQITNMPEQVSGLKTVLCHEGYISPADNGRYCLGATFDNRDSDTHPRWQDHQKNLQNLQAAVPAFFPRGTAVFKEQELSGRVSFRCASPDYLPLTGPVPNMDKLAHDYAPLGKNAHTDIPIPGSYYPGLYVSAAFGSRGMSAAPLCSELLASLINHEPRPLPRLLIHALSPARFKIRKLIRNQL